MQYYVGAAYSFIGIEILPMYYSKESFYRAIYYIYLDGVIRNGKYGVLSHKRVQNANKYKSINNLYVIRINAYIGIYQLTYQHFIRFTYIYNIGVVYAEFIQ